jgi:hypothetical protein
MKKVFFVVALAVMVLAGCASYMYRQDGLVPFEHFQAAKNAGGRLMFISPVLAPNHRQSGLYIITNPEDIQKALDTLGNPGVFPPRDLNNALKVFSPVVIQSSRDIPTVNYNSNYDISNQDGIAGFSLPPSVDQFFYAYMIIKQDYRWDSNDPAEVWIGIMSLPPGSQDVFIAFSEKEGDMVTAAITNPDAVKNAYDTTTGYYGQLLGNKTQLGFIKIGLSERVAIASEQSKARTLAEASRQSPQNITQTSSAYKTTTNQNVFSLNYSEHNDGCLVRSGEFHYRSGSYSVGMGGVHIQTRPPEHRNDNVFVRAEINRFNNEITRLNAVPADNQQAAFDNTPIGSWYFVYRINQRPDYRIYSSPRGVNENIPSSETFTTYNYNIWRVNVVAGR